jgi:hypothetical protein
MTKRVADACATREPLLCWTFALWLVMVVCRPSLIRGKGICGVLFGGLDVALMLPLQFPDKRAALLGAFLDRFAIGFVIGCVRLDWPCWIVGLTFGVLISLPSAIVTKSYAPILIGGVVGGLIIGFVIGRWGV